MTVLFVHFKLPVRHRKMKFIVMAGGQGTKLWPMSRFTRPKQFQTIVGSNSLFKTNVDALLSRFPPEDVFISTKKAYKSFIQTDAPQIPIENIILEPDIKKDQGPATGFAALKAAHRYPNEPFMVIQADCLRSPKESYLDMLEEADRLVKKDKRLITGGIRPMSPDMGSDYLMFGDKIPTDGKLEVYKIAKFVNRLGDYKKTKELIENFHVSTHCNHHCWFAGQLLDAFKEFKPNWYENLMQITEYFDKSNEEEMTENFYSQIEAGPVEVVTSHIFEREGSVILLPFRWTDVGSWSSIYDYQEHDNYYEGKEVVSLDAKGNLIKLEKEKLVVLFGVQDLVIVETPDALLVTQREKSGKMGEVLKKIKEGGLDKYL